MINKRQLIFKISFLIILLTSLPVIATDKTQPPNRPKIIRKNVKVGMHSPDKFWEVKAYAYYVNNRFVDCFKYRDNLDKDDFKLMECLTLFRFYFITHFEGPIAFALPDKSYKTWEATSEWLSDLNKEIKYYKEAARLYINTPIPDIKKDKELLLSIKRDYINTYDNLQFVDQQILYLLQNKISKDKFIKNIGNKLSINNNSIWKDIVSDFIRTDNLFSFYSPFHHYFLCTFPQEKYIKILKNYNIIELSTEVYPITKVYQ